MSPLTNLAVDRFAPSQAKQLAQTVTKLLIPHIKSPRAFILMGFQTRYRVVFHSHPHKHLAAATSAMQWLYRAEPQWQLLTLFQASADLIERSYTGGGGGAVKQITS